MSIQDYNIPNTIANKLLEKWNTEFPNEAKKDKIQFVGYVYHPDQRFQNGREIVIEVDNPSATPDQTSQGTTTINDLFKIDIWVKMQDTSDGGRERYENIRFLLKRLIMDIIHQQQKNITGLRFAQLGVFRKQDEPENNILHSIIFVEGQWFHEI